MDASGYAVGAADLCAAGIGVRHSNRFQQHDMTHKMCGPDCSAVFAVAERQRLDAKQTREARAKLKTRTEHLADAQAVFNRSIRARRGAALHQLWPAPHWYSRCGPLPLGRRSAGAALPRGRCGQAVRALQSAQRRQCHRVPHRSAHAHRDERLEFLERGHPPAKYTLEDAFNLRSATCSRPA